MGAVIFIFQLLHFLNVFRIALFLFARTLAHAMPQQHQAQSVAQAAAIPYRIDRRSGRAEVLMIRRHDGGKWGIPKGLVDPGLTHPEAAQMEALQEAGVEGPLSERALGHFEYAKTQGTYLVRVYAMKVARVREHWDEQDRRERRWFPIGQAADVCGRESVARLIRKLASILQIQAR
jgi:phosphohistidine phosphatase